MRRAASGLTLVEVLAALALLGLLSVTLTSWLQVISAIAARSAATLPWESAAEGVMRCIQEDLLVGDFVHGAQGKDKSTDPMCQLVDDRVVIRTRDPRLGSVWREYHFDPTTRTLFRATRSNSTPAQREDARLLLCDVASWSCEFDQNTQHLTVGFESAGGCTIRRSFQCPH